MKGRGLRLYVSSSVTDEGTSNKCESSFERKTKAEIE